MARDASPVSILKWKIEVLHTEFERRKAAAAEDSGSGGSEVTVEDHPFRVHQGESRGHPSD